jgi:hypothetical protein
MGGKVITTTYQHECIPSSRWPPRGGKDESVSHCWLAIICLWKKAFSGRRGIRPQIGGRRAISHFLWSPPGRSLLLLLFADEWSLALGGG